MQRERQAATAQPSKTRGRRLSAVHYGCRVNAHAAGLRVHERFRSVFGRGRGQRGREPSDTGGGGYFRAPSERRLAADLEAWGRAGPLEETTTPRARTCGAR